MMGMMGLSESLLPQVPKPSLAPDLIPRTHAASADVVAALLVEEQMTCSALDMAPALIVASVHFGQKFRYQERFGWQAGPIGFPLRRSESSCLRRSNLGTYRHRYVRSSTVAALVPGGLGSGPQVTSGLEVPHDGC